MKLNGSTNLFEKPIKKIKIKVTTGGGFFVSIEKLYQSKINLLIDTLSVSLAS